MIEHASRSAAGIPSGRRARARILGSACAVVLAGSCGGEEAPLPAPPTPPAAAPSGPPISGTLFRRLGTIKFEGARGPLVAFAEGGRTLLVPAASNGVEVWDVATGRKRSAFECAHVRIRDWAQSPDGRSLATAGDAGVRVHDLASGRETLVFSPGSVANAVAFTPDGKSLLYVLEGRPQVRFANAATGQGQSILPIDSSSRQIGFSPDPRALAVEVYGSIHLYDMANGRRWTTVPGNVLGSRFAWSRDGKALARVDAGGSLRVVDPPTGGDLLPAMELGRLETGRAAVAFSPDGSLLAVGLQRATDGPALLFVDTKTGERRAVGIERRAIDALAFSPDGSAIATANAAGVRMWSVPDGRDLARTGHEGAVATAAFSPDGRLLATGSAESVHLWRTDDWELAGRIALDAVGGLARRPQVAFAADGSLLIVDGPSVAFWDPATGRLRRQVRARLEHPGVAGALAPDASWLAIGGSAIPSAKATIARIDLQDGRAAWSVEPRVSTSGGRLKGAIDLANIVTALAISPDGGTIAAGFFAGEFLLLHAGTGREVGAFSRKGGRLLMLAFSPDGRTLAAGEHGRPPELWEVATGRLRCQVGSPTTVIIGPWFSRDGRLVAASEPDGSIVLFDVATCARSGGVGGGPPPGKANHAQTLVFGPSDTELVSGHLDHTARIWRLVR